VVAAQVYPVSAAIHRAHVPGSCMTGTSTSIETE
jgi:hypothetical protein